LSSNSTKASSSTASSKAKAKSASSRVEQARAAAQSAVDVPVGAVLEVSDRVTELVEPFSGRSTARKQLRSYGTQLRRSVKRSERRGAGVRRKATSEARKTRTRLERQARERRERVEQRVRQVADQLPAFR
jgi:hypothetical protein